MAGGASCANAAEPITESNAASNSLMEFLPAVFCRRAFRYSGGRGRKDRRQKTVGRNSMRLLLAALLSVIGSAAFAQDAPPAIPYESVPNLLKLPDDMHLGEASGVAVNSKGHIFVYTRGGSSHGPAFGNTASQVLEFDAKGKFV